MPFVRRTSSNSRPAALYFSCQCCGPGSNQRIGQSFRHLFTAVANHSFRMHSTTLRTAKKGRGSLIVMEKDAALRQHLLDVLKAGNAHAVFHDVIKDFPAELRGKRPKGAPHSAWELLEH